MEHIVQFAIGVDDARIVKEIETAAVKSISEEITNQAMKKMFICEKDWYGKITVKEPTEWMKKRFEDFLEENKNAIIKMAASNLADKMARTKAVKEAAAKAVEDI